MNDRHKTTSARQELALRGKKVRRPPRQRRVAVLLVLFLVVYFTYTPICSSIIGGKLREAVASRLRAELQYESLTYIFPYQVRINRARLTTHDNRQLFSVEHLDLQLARLPLPNRPLVVKHLALQSPRLRVIRTDSGIVSPGELRRPDNELRQRPPRHKLSEMFQLRKLAISNGSIVYEDHTIPDSVPLAFGNISVDIGITPRSGSQYACTMMARQPPLAELDASGTFDIDTLVMELSQLQLTAQSQRDSDQSALPPRVQQFIDRFQIDGTLELTGSGFFPLRDHGSARWSGDLRLRDATALFRDEAGRIERLNARLHADFAPDERRIVICELAGQSGSVKLVIDDEPVQEIRIGSEVVEFDNLQGSVLDGQFAASGRIRRGRPLEYELDVALSQIDLAQLESAPFMRGGASSLKGRGHATAHITGIVPRDGSGAIDYLRASGRLRVREGHFWEIPVVSAIAKAVGVGRESLTLGDAAAIWSIDSRVIQLHRAAINSRVLGVQGSGTISFAGESNLEVIAAPLGDWRDQIRRTRIPILSDVASQIVGELQKMVNAATKRLLYQFQVRGPVSAPQIHPIPAPLLTETAAKVFGQMLREAQDLELLRSLEELPK